VPGQIHRTPVAVALVGLALALTGGGCAFGPRILEQTHGRYYESVRLVHEEQLLRNLVHMRYNEGPGSLEVSAITAQYELTGQAEARPFFLAPNPSNSNVIFKTFTSILPDVLVGGSNRPTLTLTPSFDGTAVRRFLTPITSDFLVFVSQTNWPVSVILRLWVERLNGVPNATPASGPPRDAIPDFVRFQLIAELFQFAQDHELLSLHTEERVTEVSGPLPADRVTASALVEAAKDDLEYRPRDDGGTWVLVRKERRLVLEVNAGAEGSPELQELAGLLNLLPGLRRYELAVVTGVPDPLLHPTPPGAAIRLAPRSTSQVFFYLANGVEVPPEHLACGLVKPAVDAEGRVFDTREVTRGLFEVHSCKGHKPPAGAYVAVKYRGYWYYIDDQDQASKATMALMTQMSRLDFARQRTGGAGPVLTLPVGR
jgi:hypothetical protein